ncbi:RHS repeat domain-containing protein [Fibrella sp. WM1]|uniref:RHS repeat domain-containing protein n=1 Tax=Fibrella musci TaxID=3242485 RepID=UPI003522E33E
MVTDHLGTPLELVDEGGGVVWGAQLDSYGRIRQGTGKASLCPFRYQGQYEDVEAGCTITDSATMPPGGDVHLSGSDQIDGRQIYLVWICRRHQRRN